jgi:hypothetical protein
MIPPGFPRRSRWWIVALLAGIFSLPAIIAWTAHEWELRPLQRYYLPAYIACLERQHQPGIFGSDGTGARTEGQIAGPQIEARSPLGRVGIGPRIPSGVGRRITTSSGVTWTRKKASSIDPEAPCQHGPIRLAESIAMSMPATPFWQLKPVVITHRIRRSSRHSSAVVQQADSSPQQR